MKRVLITGPTGNVGSEVLAALTGRPHGAEIVAGVRDTEADGKKLARYGVGVCAFDFGRAETYGPALAHCDVLFLLRPPQISAVRKIFGPLIAAAKTAGVRHIIFLSVQGVEKNRVIPHHKIEELIKKSGIAYTFLRPAYFMQNFTTTLLDGIVKERRIFLPAGTAKFTLVDTRDIGAVAAVVIMAPHLHAGSAYELTAQTALTFGEMAQSLSAGLGVQIRYRSPSLVAFFREKRSQGTPPMFIAVMIMLHYLPRFGKAPDVTDWVEKITSKAPIEFAEFIEDYKAVLLASGNTRQPR